MLTNAQQYNRPDSRIHRDAVTLQAAVQAAVGQLQKAAGKASTPRPGKIVAHAMVPQVLAWELGRHLFVTNINRCFITLFFFFFFFKHFFLYS